MEGISTVIRNPAIIPFAFIVVHDAACPLPDVVYNCHGERVKDLATAAYRARSIPLSKPEGCDCTPVAWFTTVSIRLSLLFTCINRF